MNVKIMADFSADPYWNYDTGANSDIYTVRAAGFIVSDYLEKSLAEWIEDYEVNEGFVNCDSCSHLSTFVAIGRILTRELAYDNQDKKVFYYNDLTSELEDLSFN